MEDHCTNCGKPEPATGWYATFGIGMKPEWFCTKECFEAVTEAEEELAEAREKFLDAMGEKVDVDVAS